MSDKKPLSRIAAEKCAETYFMKPLNMPLEYDEAYRENVSTKTSELEPLIASVYADFASPYVERAEQLEAALIKYGSHLKSCNIYQEARKYVGDSWYPLPCNCGFEEAKRLHV